MLTRQCFLLFASAALAVSCATAPKAPAVAERAGALLAEAHQAGAFSGAVIISRDGKTLYQGAFGSAGDGRPFTLDTPVDGASLAKTVTAAAIFLLVDDGKVELDRLAADYAPAIPYPAVTVRHLLSHAAGMPDYTDFEAELTSGAVIDNRALMRLAGARNPAFGAGAAFSYCNLCYDALALVVEAVSGQPYEAFVRERLLIPAGATNAFLRPARFADWNGPRTLGFRSSLPGADVFDIFDNEGFYGAANLYFSARDLDAWARAFANRRVLPAAVEEAALAPAMIGERPSHLELASWYCDDGAPRCHYTGHHQGFYNLVYWDAADRLTIVFVSNSAMPAPVQAWLGPALRGIADGERVTDRPAFDGMKERSVDLAAVQGAYRFLSAAQNTVIEVDGETAFLTSPDRPRLQLHDVGYDTLYAPGADAYLSFCGLKDGRYRSVHWRGMQGVHRGFRADGDTVSYAACDE